jgi:NAD(P)-dependent dehydrogenase (short-subunit alcohol dehydrogenase family)
VSLAERFSLQDRVAVVTGASRGLGRAIALGLAEAGADLVLSSRAQPDLDALAAEVERGGRRALALATDVVQPDALQRLADAALGRFGRVDVLINNAGISPVFKRSELMDLADWRQILDVNLTGAFVACQVFGRIMLQQQRGVIVNMTSVAARSGFPRLSAYCASKGGLEALTRVLGVEWATQGVRVNAIGPAFVETDMTADVRAHQGISASLLQRTPMRRYATPEEIVGAALFLASDASSYMTGQVVYPDGGWLAG